jgi:hypothetical protein
MNPKKAEGGILHFEKKSWFSFLLISCCLLPPSQNVRRLSFSQKSIYFKFEQIYA